MAGDRRNSVGMLRARLLLAGAGTASLAFGLAGPAAAADECGTPSGTPATVTCAAATYANGISYAPVADLTVIAPDDVIANGTVEITGSNDHRFEGREGATITTAGETGLFVNGSSGFAGVSSVVTSGDNATGISVDVDNAATVDAGGVSTSGNSSTGIFARSKYGPVAVDSVSVVTSGANADGIQVRYRYSYSESAAATVDSGSVETGGRNSTGIDVSASGDVAISSGSVATLGNYATGIEARSRDGTVTIDSGTVSTAGTYSGGISVGGKRGSDGSSVVITSESVTTTGKYSVGIVASGLNISIDSGSIVTSGERSAGIGAYSYGSSDPAGLISITSDSIETAGTSADGIRVSARGSGAGAPAVLVNSGDIATTGADAEGIEIRGSKYDDGRVTVNSSGTITTAGASADGISAYGAGRIVIDSNAIEVTGAGSVGIRAIVREKYFGVPTAVKSAPVALAAADVATNGGVQINTGSVTATDTGAPAVIGGVYGTGDVDVTVDGAVSTTGDNSVGISTFLEDDDGPATGAITVNVTGSGGVSTTGKFSHGIAAIVSEEAVGGDVLVSVGAGRTVQTGGDFAHGVFIENGSTGTNDVNVSGVLATGLDQVNSFAVYSQDSGATDVTIAQGGTLRYKVLLSDFDDTVVNNGTFDSFGISRFRGGDDSFVNNGILLARRGTSELGGLEMFTNDGTIDMRDGSVGDVLALSGDYVGMPGSFLNIDVDFDEETSDLLTIEGRATGTTIVNINGGNDLNVDFERIRFVDAADGTAADVFTLVGGNTDTGIVAFDIEYDAATDDYFLVPGLGASALEFSQFAELNTNVWYRSADAVIAQIASGRDVNSSGRPGLGTWVQLLDGRSDIDAFQSNGNRLFDLSYEQFYTGIQGGLDYAMGGLVIGITGGVGWSNTEFALSGNRIDADVSNIGAYFSYRAGGFHADLLAKYDWLQADVRSLGFVAEFDARSYGALLDIGYRLGGDGFWVEPVASIAYVENDIDDVQFGVNVAELDGGHSVRGSAGVRIGGTMQVGGGTFVPFLSARAVDDLEGETETRFRGTTFSLTDDLPGAYAELGGGASLAIRGFEAFVRGDVQLGLDEDGRDVAGHTLRAGVKLRF